MRRLSWIFAFLIATTSAHGAEISLFGGYRTGGPSVEQPPIFCFRAPCPQPSQDARDGEAFGLVLDLPFRDQLMFEILISHQSGEFELGDLAFIEIYPSPVRQNEFDLTYLHLGLLRQWQKARVSPFAAVGLGIAQLEAERPFFLFDTIDEDRLSASLAGGVKIHLNKWLGVRLEGRGYWADMPNSVSEDIFQMELNTGLTFKL